MKYMYKNYRFPVPAQIAGERLGEINKEKGELTPKLVVEDARPEESVLHPCFEWNDYKAGEKWREHEAAHLIRTVTIMQPTKKEPVEVRAFVNIERPDKQINESKYIYKPIQEVLSNKETREQLMNRAYAELVTWHKRYEVYKELSEYASEIKNIASTMKTKEEWLSGRPMVRV